MRCECTSVIKRMKHAVISTVTVCHDGVGHRHLSSPRSLGLMPGSLQQSMDGIRAAMVSKIVCGWATKIC